MDETRQRPSLLVPVRMPMGIDQHSDPVLCDYDNECLVLLLAAHGRDEYLGRIRFLQPLASRQLPTRAVTSAVARPIWHRAYNTMFLVENSRWLAELWNDSSCRALDTQQYHFLIAGLSHSVEIVAAGFWIDYLRCSEHRASQAGIFQRQQQSVRIPYSTYTAYSRVFSG